MDDPALGSPPELEVDLPVGAALAAALGHRPAFAPIKLADQPLELLGVQQSEVARPLDEVPAVARLDLDEEPAEKE